MKTESPAVNVLSVLFYQLELSFVVLLYAVAAVADLASICVPRSTLVMLALCMLMLVQSPSVVAHGHIEPQKEWC